MGSFLSQTNENNGKNVKSHIYFARTYRYLHTSIGQNVLYILLLIVPCLFLLIFFMDDITYGLSSLAVKVLGSVFAHHEFSILGEDFALLNTMAYVGLPTVYPQLSFVFWNMLVMFVVLLILGFGRAKGKPVTIYLMLNLIVHLANCIYFIFAMDYFPYSATQFSELYMEQQMGIWITFIILTALVTGFLGNKGYVYRVITFFAIMAYSFLFGTVRYIVFMFLVTRFSILYMAPMFFSFGPLFDFLYLVAIYSVFVNRMVKLYDSAEGRGEWRW